MHATRLALTAFILTLSGCVCGTGLDSREYLCATNDQCADGYHCDDVRAVCVLDGATGGGAGGGGFDAGFDAGGDDAGEGDSGVDAGRDAGPSVGDAGIGARCGASSDCANNRCVDGRCCNADCGGSCDFCDVQGQEGSCVSASGRAPSPACPGDYACAGNGPRTCLTSCSSDAGCVSGRCSVGSVGGVCIQKSATLVEDFNSGGLDASVWLVSGQCAVINQQLRVTTTAATTAYPNIRSVRRFDLLDSELSLELIDPGNQLLLSMQAFATACSSSTSQRCLQLLVNQNGVSVWMSDATDQSPIIPAVPLAGRRVLRLREAAGVLSLGAKDANGQWQVIGAATTPNRADFSDVLLNVGAGTYAAESTVSTVIWDNLNVP